MIGAFLVLVATSPPQGPVLEATYTEVVQPGATEHVEIRLSGLAREATSQSHVVITMSGDSDPGSTNAMAPDPSTTDPNATNSMATDPMVAVGGRVELRSEELGTETLEGAITGRQLWNGWHEHCVRGADCVLPIEIHVPEGSEPVHLKLGVSIEGLVPGGCQAPPPFPDGATLEVR